MSGHSVARETALLSFRKAIFPSPLVARYTDIIREYESRLRRGIIVGQSNGGIAWM